MPRPTAGATHCRQSPLKDEVVLRTKPRGHTCRAGVPNQRRTSGEPVANQLRTSGDTPLSPLPMARTSLDTDDVALPQQHLSNHSQCRNQTPGATHWRRPINWGRGGCRIAKPPTIAFRVSQFHGPTSAKTDGGSRSHGISLTNGTQNAKIDLDQGIAGAGARFRAPAGFTVRRIGCVSQSRFDIERCGTIIRFGFVDCRDSSG